MKYRITIEKIGDESSDSASFTDEFDNESDLIHSMDVMIRGIDRFGFEAISDAKNEQKRKDSQGK